MLKAGDKFRVNNIIYVIEKVQYDRYIYSYHLESNPKIRSRGEHVMHRKRMEQYIKESYWKKVENGFYKIYKKLHSKCKM